MGINWRLIVNQPVNEIFICPICSDVFDDPLQCPNEHIFCSSCIREWTLKNSTCPLDRQRITFDSLNPVARVFRNQLDDLDAYCEFEHLGCTEPVKLGSYREHVLNCQFEHPDSKRDKRLHNLENQVRDLVSHARVKDLELNAIRTELNVTHDELIAIKEENRVLRTIMEKEKESSLNLISMNNQISSNQQENKLNHAVDLVHNRLQSNSNLISSEIEKVTRKLSRFNKAIALIDSNIGEVVKMYEEHDAMLTKLFEDNQVSLKIKDVMSNVDFAHYNLNYANVLITWKQLEQVLNGIPTINGHRVLFYKTLTCNQVAYFGMCLIALIGENGCLYDKNWGTYSPQFKEQFADLIDSKRFVFYENSNASDVIEERSKISYFDLIVTYSMNSSKDDEVRQLKSESGNVFVLYDNHFVDC